MQEEILSPLTVLSDGTYQLNISEEEFKTLYMTLSFTELKQRFGLSSYILRNFAWETFGIKKPLGRKRKKLIIK